MRFADLFRGRTRSWIWAVAALCFGLGLDYYDDWCESIGVPVVKAILNNLEIAIMGPGMAALAFLLSEHLRSKERRYQERVAGEREGRFRFLGRIAASVAHEIRNPLHNVHLLCAELRLQAPGDAVDLVDRIRANLDRLDQANLLIYELAKPPNRRSVENCAHATDLIAIVDAAIGDLAGDDGAPAVVVDGPPPGPLVVACRPEALRISVHNLLRNAVEAADGRAVHVSYRDAGERIELLIRNPGEMPARAIDASDDGVASMKPGGLGVGIAISRHLLSMYDARLDFECASGTVLTRIAMRKAA